jgi:uridine kinase
METVNAVIIGIAGGSGCGKTLAVDHIRGHFDKTSVIVIHQDSYYTSIADDESAANYNFDHPDAIDWDLLNNHIQMLSEGNSAEIPEYCFVTHKRKENTKTVMPSKIIVVEGILVLYNKKLRARLDCAIFIDTDSDVRLFRRIGRDMSDRGRTLESIRHQYNRFVRPAYKKFVEPCKTSSDMIIRNNNDGEFVGIKMLLFFIHGIIENKTLSL